MSYSSSYSSFFSLSLKKITLSLFFSISIYILKIKKKCFLPVFFHFSFLSFYIILSLVLALKKNLLRFRLIDNIPIYKALLKAPANVTVRVGGVQATSLCKRTSEPTGKSAQLQTRAI